MGVRARVAAVAALVVGTVPAVLSPTAAAATYQVVARNFAFATTPNCNGSGGPVTTVQAGDTVTWRVCEGGHTVTADDGRFDSGNTALTVGQTFSFTFTTPGQFDYYCRIHGSRGGVGMAGTVIVLGAPGPTPAPTPPPTARPATTTTTTRPATTTTTTRPATTTTTSRPLPATTAAPTTTTAPPSPTTTEAVEEEGGGGVAEETTTTERADRLEEAGAEEPDDGGTNPGAVAALVAGILAVAGVAFWLWRRISPG